jgi:hypothetical protein
MRRIPLLSILLSAAFTAACAQQQAAAVPGVCEAQPAQFAIGYTFTDALVQEVQRRSGAKVARVIRPGTVTTMEHSEERVNLEVDASNRVRRVRCG